MNRKMRFRVIWYPVAAISLAIRLALLPFALLSALIDEYVLSWFKWWLLWNCGIVDERGRYVYDDEKGKSK